jgi:YD repeat-containing protein
MEYDAKNQLVKMIEADGSISTFTYDKEGRQTKADYGNGLYVDYGYTGTRADWTSIDGPTIGHIERKFTDDGRLAGWVTADGGQIKFEYDVLGRLAREIDPAGRATEYTYDAAGRLIKTTDSLTGASLTKAYDAIGRVTQQTDSLGNTTTYSYNDDEQTITVTDALGHSITSKRDGQTSSFTDALGRTTTSSLSSYFLPTSTTYADGTTSSVEYLYNNNLQEAKDYPTRVVDTAGRDRRFTYDSFGRLITATDIADAVTNLW